ncbi:cysteine--tRNA ligase [Nonomuraea wenchangensis]
MLRIHDTRAGQVVPVQLGRLVRIYTCGPAGHRRAHVGDLRTYVLADLVRRVLERRRARVLACQNITDLGHPTGVDHADAFRADATALNLRPPEHTPRASENVEPMVELIAKLVERGHAYAVPDGSVFFDVRTFPAYGELSGDRPEEPRPADWALWKPGDGELTWDSPWGRGFPGPHVGCSAMSLRFLGPVVDLHLGGIDLRFPHHEDERAQSDAVTGHEVVRHWVHGEHLLFDGREMAESTGNVVLLSDVTAAGLDPLAVRMAFLEHRYRRRLDLTWDTLRAADRTLRRWRSRVAEWAESPSAPMAAGHVERVESALGDDLDTPAALRVLRELERDESVPPGAKLEAFLHVDQVLGLDLPIDIGKAPTLPAGAGELLEARSRAREAADWTEADRLRDELAELGVRVSDTPSGQTWT